MPADQWDWVKYSDPVGLVASAGMQGPGRWGSRSMSKTKRKQPAAPDPPLDEATPATSKRIDPAHAPAHAGETKAETAGHDDAPAASAEDLSEAARQQLETQAQQLADHLQARQERLDRREAEIHAQLALVEREMRGARLWAEEQEADLKRREEQLAAREADLEVREAQRAATQSRVEAKTTSAERDLAGREKTVAKRQQEVEQAVTQLTEQADSIELAHVRLAAHRDETERRLQHERQRIDNYRETTLRTVRQALAGVEAHREAVEAELVARREALASAPPEPTAREAGSAIEDNAARERGREEAESRLAEQLAEVALFRADLEAKRHELDQRIEQAEQELSDAKAFAEADLARKQNSLERRAARQEQRREALEQMRRDVAEQHRESLEMRLATEELWAQMAGSGPAAGLTVAVGQIRRRMDDHYRLANTELAEQRAEIRTLCERLKAERDALAVKRHDVQDWVARRQAELERLAADLTARQHELAEKEADVERAVERERAERLSGTIDFVEVG